MKYVYNGIIGNSEPEQVLVESESDLDDLTVPVGSIAFTVGYGSQWMLGADGTWTSYPITEDAGSAASN
jgi:hypothetical protein